MRRGLARVRSLAGLDRWLLWEAFFLVAGLRIGLRLLPFRGVRRIVDTLAGGRAPTAAGGARGQGVMICQITLSVNAVGGLLRAMCLPRALAVHIMMARRRLPSDLRIGVSRAPGEALEAHAWVEDESGVVFGSLPDQSRFVPLPAPALRTS